MKNFLFSTLLFMLPFSMMAQQEPLNLTLNINGYNVKTLLVDEALQPMNPDKKGNLKITIQPSSGAVLY